MTLRTSRLVLRPLVVEDAAAIFPLFSDVETVRYWNTYPHQDEAVTAAMIAEIISRDRSCYWAVCLPGTDRAVGYVGYIGNPGTPALVYILAPEQRGKGYAGEAIRAALGYGFDSLRLERVEAWIHPDNNSSIRTAEKAGFSYRGSRRMMFVNSSIPHDLFVYGIEASEWLHVAGPLADSGGDQRFYALRIVLAVNDVHKTLRFYLDSLGFGQEYCHGDPPIEAGVSAGRWSSDNLRIHFVASDEKVRPSGYLYFVVGADIDGLYQRYRSRGVAFDFEPRRTAAGGREFQISDPDGHRLRFGTI